MRLIDISVPLTPSTPLWPGSEPVKIHRIQDFDRGDSHAVSHFELGAHAGTHLDAPHHFLPEGSLLEDIPLETLIGPCRVLDVSRSIDDHNIIGVKTLRVAGAPDSPEASPGPRSAAGPADHAVRMPRSAKAGIGRAKEMPPRVLLKTRAEGFWDEAGRFDRSFAGLDTAAAEFLIDSGVRLLGLDSPSVEPYESPGNPVHQRLLAAGVVLLETLRLSHVAAGDYELICLSPRLLGVEAAPCRAVLRVPEDRPAPKP